MKKITYDSTTYLLNVWKQLYAVFMLIVLQIVDIMAYWCEDDEDWYRSHPHGGQLPEGSTIRINEDGEIIVEVACEKHQKHHNQIQQALVR